MAASHCFMLTGGWIIPILLMKTESSHTWHSLKLIVAPKSVPTIQCPQTMSQNYLISVVLVFWTECTWEANPGKKKNNASSLQQGMPGWFLHHSSHWYNACQASWASKAKRTSWGQRTTQSHPFSGQNNKRQTPNAACCFFGPLRSWPKISVKDSFCKVWYSSIGYHDHDHSAIFEKSPFEHCFFGKTKPQQKKPNKNIYYLIALWHLTPSFLGSEFISPRFILGRSRCFGQISCTTQGFADQSFCLFETYLEQTRTNQESLETLGGFKLLLRPKGMIVSRSPGFPKEIRP